MSHFAPVDADGFATFEGGAAAGWYQLATPTATLPELPGITVPPEAQGMLIQATAELAYCFAPESVGSNPEPFSLPAGGTRFFSGQSWLRNLCIKVDANTAFSIQFCAGSTGPIPKL